MTVERNRNSQLAVSTASVEVSPMRDEEERTVISLTNVSTGTQVISIAIGAEAVAGVGIVLSPGGFYQESRDANKITQDQVNAISDASGGLLAVSERIKMRGDR